MVTSPLISLSTQTTAPAAILALQNETGSGGFQTHFGKINNKTHKPKVT